MEQLEATVSLPFPSRDRATSALRGWLRLAAADAGTHPDWATLAVTELADDVDDHGRTWWQWNGSVDVTAVPRGG